MSERGVLFSGEMVRAILSGSKTVTRRPFTWPLRGRSDGAKQRLFMKRDADEVNALLAERQRHPHRIVQTPFGQAGDRLYVRESHRFPVNVDDCPASAIGGRCTSAGYPSPWCPTRYEADEQETYEGRGARLEAWGGAWGKLRPSIHMPEWASRITLRVTDVRVERLQAITEEDAAAEGFTADPREGRCNGEPATLYPMSCRMAFVWGWNALYKQRGYGWAESPWVWRVAFERVEE